MKEVIRGCEMKTHNQGGRSEKKDGKQKYEKPQTKRGERMHPGHGKKGR